MKFLPVIIWAVIALAAFFYAWRAGYVTKVADYVRQTQEELKKCTWPSWSELKGSTVVVMISLFLLGLFTVCADALYVYGLGGVVNWLSKSS